MKSQMTSLWCHYLVSLPLLVIAVVKVTLYFVAAFFYYTLHHAINCCKLYKELDIWKVGSAQILDFVEHIRHGMQSTSRYGRTRAHPPTCYVRKLKFVFSSVNPYCEKSLQGFVNWCFKTLHDKILIANICVCKQSTTSLETDYFLSNRVCVKLHPGESTTSIVTTDIFNYPRVFRRVEKSVRLP